MSKTVMSGFQFPLLMLFYLSPDKCGMGTSSGDMIVYSPSEFFKGQMRITISYMKGIYLIRQDNHNVIVWAAWNPFHTTKRKFWLQFTEGTWPFCPDNSSIVIASHYFFYFFYGVFISLTLSMGFKFIVLGKVYTHAHLSTAEHSQGSLTWSQPCPLVYYNVQPNSFSLE